MKMNKLVALLAALCILCGALPMMSLTASAADVTLTTAYDAASKTWVEGLDTWNFFRHENWLVRYDYGYDAATDLEANKGNHASNKQWYVYKDWYTGANATATNQYGIEIAVNEYNIVTAIEDGKGNMTIPENGYVLSANGTKATTIRNLVANGSLAVGCYMMTGDSQINYTAYKVTDDSKFMPDAFSLKYTQLYGGSYAKGITIGGDGVRTGTNEWNNDVLVKITGAGADATKYQGYVVKFGGNNIEVPEGYFAISFYGQTMHDTGLNAYNAAWLVQQFAAPGAIVNCGSAEVFFRYDAVAAQRAALLMTGKTYSTTVDATYDYSAKAIIEDAKTNYELVDIDAMQALYDNMLAITDAVAAMGTAAEMEPYMATLYQNYAQLSVLEFEKRPVEMRAVWIRPLPNDRVERSAEELDQLLEEAILENKALGYNQIFVEAFYNSCTIFPVPETAGHKGLYYSQNPYLVPTDMTTGSAGLAGKNSKLTEPYDMLQRFIDICRENDVEPHIWWEVFYVGYTRTDPNVKDALFEYSVAKQILDSLDKGETTYNNWINQAHTGSYYYGAETDGAHQYFLSPASDNVRTFLLNTFAHIFETYDAESLQLDYIRYPHTNAEKCFGYDAGTLWKFQQSDLYDPAVHTDAYLKTYEGFYDEAWVQFRADFVTTFIEQVRETIETVNPSYYLTSSPGADPADSKKNLMQDVAYWLENDLIDVLYPMAYGENVPGMVAPGLVANNPDHFVCVGSSASYNSDAYEMRWLKEIRDAGADGIAGFGTIDSWKTYAWSEDAITPTGNATKAASVYFHEVLLARAAQMLKFGDIDEATYETIQAAVEYAAFAIRVNGVESEEALTAINAVQVVADTLGADPKTAMTNDVNYILKIRLNSHDKAKQVADVEDSSSTLTVNGNKVIDGGDGFSYVTATETLYVTADNVVIGGKMNEAITVVFADGVKDVEFDGAEFGAAEIAVDTVSDLTVYLSGVSRINGELPDNITYIGTGELYSGDALVMCKGDVTGDDKLTSDDLRNLLQYNVKMISFTDEQILIGDVNGDGKVNTIDTRSYLNKLVNAL